MHISPMKSPISWILFSCLLLSLVTSPPLSILAQTTPSYSQDFEDEALPGWSLESGWGLAESEGGHALRGSGHFWARFPVHEWEDLLVQFRVKLEPGAALHANLRVKETSRYFIGFDPGGTSLSKQTGPSGFQHDLSSSKIPLRSGWHWVQMAATGNEVLVAIDGKQVMQWQDPVPLPAGFIAFESLENEVVWLDDLMVYTYERTQPFPLQQVQATTEPQTLLPTIAPQQTSPLPTGIPARILPAADLTWVYTGGPLGGLGYDIRMRPDNPDELFVTDALAGVFRSSDGGQTWSPSNNGINSRLGTTGELIPVFSLTIDPNNPEIVWTGTQFQRGIFKSIDGGHSWAKMVNGVSERDLTVRGFTIEPGNSDVVYFAAEISSWEWAGQSRQGKEFDLVKGTVYKSINGGQSWKKVWAGDNLARYIWIDPRDTQVLYVSTGIFDREAANSDHQAGNPGGVGILKSTDGGQSWNQVNTGLLNLYVGSLFMHPENPDILIAGTGNVTFRDNAGVYITENGGKTWRKTLDTNGDMVEAVEISINDPRVAYAGCFGSVYRSEDGGYEWKRISGEQEGWGAPGVMAGHPIDFQVDPRDPNRLFSNQYGGGNFLSQDGGKTWEDASKGYTGSMVRDLAVDPTHPGRVLAASRGGLFVSYNGGEEWEGINQQPFYFLDWHLITIHPSNPLYLFSGLTCWQNLVQSEDGGQSWTEINTLQKQRTAFRQVVFSTAHPARGYAATSGYFSCGSFDRSQPGAGVYISNDGGHTWQQSPDVSIMDTGMNQLAVNPHDPNQVMAASIQRGLLSSIDGGQTWAVLGGGLPAGQSYNSVAFNPQDGKVIFAGRESGGLYLSTDGGETWTIVGAGLPPEASPVDIIFDPFNTQVMYTADLFSGVYRSTDGGQRWQAINQGLNLRSVNSLALSGDGMHLYAGTDGNGVYRLDLNGQPPASAPRPAPPQSPTPTSLPTHDPATQVASQPTSAPESPADMRRFLPCFPAGFMPLAGVLILTGKRWKQQWK